MAQSVSNEALWLKLSEMDKKLDEVSVAQKSVTPTQEQAKDKPDFNKLKEEIITEIKGDIRILGLSNDSHFAANKQNIERLNDNTVKVLNIVSRIRKQQKETVEPPAKSKENFFDFRLFKVKKASLVITVLSLLVFILTLFCMKQQNDYALLIDEYYRQNSVIRGMQQK